MNKGYVILGTLIRANLLTEAGGPNIDVKMHDVVREMALWIASNFGKQKENFVVQARVGLRQIPKVEDWGAVRRMSLMGNKIEEITCGSKCSELTTLFLQNNDLKNLSGEFIRSMQKLVVLDLSFNRNFSKLPEQISQLTSLRYLDLSCTSIEQLPVGFQELKKLTHLDLSDTKIEQLPIGFQELKKLTHLDLSNTKIEQLPVGFQELEKLTHLDLTFTEELCSISGVSKLSSLRILKLQRSKVHGDVSLLKELQLLEHLQVLTITISTESGLEHILGDPRLANCIDSLHIHGFEHKPFSILSLMSMENLCYLCVEESHVTEIDTDLKYGENPCFPNLSTVYVTNCNSNKDLTWLLFAPNLVRLTISHSEEVEEIINKEKTTNLTGIIIPFQKLEICMLENLPKLESIYWSPLPFPCLRIVYAATCPNLRKLPFNATSVPRLGEFSITVRPQEQITDLEWEDEDTKNRFLPSFRRVIISEIDLLSSETWNNDSIYDLFFAQ